ncbi:GNAT family N-acetyltransferase [Virgibacillus litoralis]|uniref:Ribosomal-protein-alanine N-acetyltransferase n=1 Tax=Virgibacillus litoralis TaxID=578221 RepID=A0ABS4H985_9BACI|nr:GNAT family N-acetyltransferase [Virgibacillus litoralis]MBP1947471.1 ribosomal-protein-alanine N-acetyltransferase [Virgibacillus litoralis]
MDYAFEFMTQEQAEDIAYNWHYDGIYSFYDIEADKEDLAVFLDSYKRNSTYVVTKDSDVVGFFSFNKTENNTIDLGLAMRPDLTGSGNGSEFVKAGMEFAKSNYSPDEITLSVATFNQRAIKVYRKIGFKDVETFMQDTNGSSFEFLKMVYYC